jgi:FixJ family two-component response regulator
MSTSRRHIAIVDDDPGVLKALARLSEAYSFHPRTYSSASEFLASLRHERPDCLVLDVQLPEKTGLELQHELARQGLNIPTIVITAQNEIGLREACERAGAWAFLQKPLDLPTLIAAMKRAVAGKESNSG